MADEVKKIDVERDAFARISADYQAGIDSIADERIRVSNDVVALVRAQLKGFDPKLLDSDTDLPEVLGEVESQESFLAGMKRLQEDEHLWFLVQYLTRNQVLYTATEAVTLEQQNFGRATLNGYSILREEINRLATVHAVRHAATPEFDEHEVV